jgi:hypothetical protein
MTPGADRPGAGRRDWRPMPFGRRAARTVRDPVIEPLWPGRRVLVHVAAAREGPPSMEIVDEDGLSLTGHPELQSALSHAVRANALVLDAYLVAVPRRDAVGMFGGELAVGVPGLAGTTRQLVLGARAPRGDRVVAEPGARTASTLLPDDERADAAAGAAGVSTGVGGVAALVAVDLLAIDTDDLLDVPLLERKRQLDAALVPGEYVRLGPHVRPPAEFWYGQWRAFGFREIAVKSANSRYSPGSPSNDWTTAVLPRG